jgi:hypothetical protein
MAKMTFILGREGNKLFFDATDDTLNFHRYGMAHHTLRRKERWPCHDTRR